MIAAITKSELNYAIRALIYLDQHKDEGPTLGAVIAEKENIPAPFLAKVLGHLSSAGVIDSKRGRNGGYILKVDAQNLPLSKVASFFEHPDKAKQCLLGYGICKDNDSTCPIHIHWAKPNKSLNNFLDNTTIADLSSLLSQDKKAEIRDNCLNPISE